MISSLGLGSGLKVDVKVRFRYVNQDCRVFANQLCKALPLCYISYIIYRHKPTAVPLIPVESRRRGGGQVRVFSFLVNMSPTFSFRESMRVFFF